MSEGCDALTEKEKETLRLMVRGHDAKSMASELSLSVHTINERLRAARRKLDVTSSREAARLLFESEAGSHEKSVDESFGDARDGQTSHDPPVVKRASKTALLIGAIIMSLLAAALLLSTPMASHDGGAKETEHPARDMAVEVAAQSWLKLVDARDWEASYAATASSFRKANSIELWRDTATQVQGELGETLSRQLLGVDDVPSPQGIVMVRYRTDFANGAGKSETLSMVLDGGEWKVAGIYIS